MSDRSARLFLPFLQPAQAQKHVTHNTALELLDVLVQPRVLGLNVTTPPSLPQEGAVYGVGAGANDAWAGQDGQIAAWDAEAWRFVEPQEGWQVLLLPEQRVYLHIAGDWQPLTQDMQNLDGLGIATTSDATNRLALASEASLFSHAGAGHQLKINKAAATDTASLLFQSGWTGHAEMGLAGDINWALKVSADGSAWTTALSVDAASGKVSGAAVQASAADVTPGRLMRADYGYGRGNLLGPVSQAGGVPTGAVLERGSNANGSYTRFADGTQICRATVTLAYSGAAVCSATWTFPAGFTDLPNVMVSINSTVNATPLENHMAACRINNLSAASTMLRQPRITGTQNFSTGDTMTVEAIAFGNWF